MGRIIAASVNRCKKSNEIFCAKGLALWEKYNGWFLGWWFLYSFQRGKKPLSGQIIYLKNSKLC
jgi:hypothetical protein